MLMFNTRPFLSRMLGKQIFIGMVTYHDLVKEVGDLCSNVIKQCSNFVVCLYVEYEMLIFCFLISVCFPITGYWLFG